MSIKEDKVTNKKTHISFSELKDWNFCPYYRKLVQEDGANPFTDSIFTVFGTSIHSICETMVKGEDSKKLFESTFLDNIKNSPIQPTEQEISSFTKEGKDILEEVLEALGKYFGKYEVVQSEEQLFEKINDFSKGHYDFKGFIDLVLKTEDGKIHIIDWKTCSWGWDAEKKNDKMTTYQLTLYKKFYAQKYNVDVSMIETHFALLKRTAKAGSKVEIFRVTSGPKKIENATNLLVNAVTNITAGRHVKNRLSCTRCNFNKTEHCK